MHAMDSDGRLMVATRQDGWLVFSGRASVSVLAHIIIVMLLAQLVVPHSLTAPRERVVAVDIVSPDQVPSLQKPQPAVSPSPPIRAASAPRGVPPQAPPALPAKAVPPASASPVKGQKVEATAFYAAGILSDPKNAALRRNFNSLASSEQLIQLCNIEALEQLARDKVGQPGAAPDTVVGYAFGDLDVSGTTLVADGGAYRQGGAWYRLSFDCSSNADGTAIAGFDYRLGDTVPPSQWEEHFLNAADDALD